MRYMFVVLNFLFISSYVYSSLFLYELRKEKDSTPLYIMGTQHSFPLESCFPSIVKFMLSKQVLITENADLNKKLTRQYANSYGMLKKEGEPSILDLSVEHQKKLRSYVIPFLESHKAEFSMEELNLGSALEAYIQGHFLNGMDRKLFQHFNNANKKIFGLESIKDIQDFFVQSPSLEMFIEGLEHDFGFGSDLDRISALNYLQGIYSPFFDGDEEGMEEVKLRNLRWLPKIIDYHQNYASEMIVCVGVDHLFGDFGLLQLLKTEGYSKLNVVQQNGEFKECVFPQITE